MPVSLSGDTRLSTCGAAVLRKAGPAVRRQLRCCDAASASNGGVAELGWPRLAAGTSVLRRSVGLALLVCIRSTSRADSVQAAVAARSCDLRTSKQTAATFSIAGAAKPNVCWGSRREAGGLPLMGGAELADLVELLWGGAGAGGASPKCRCGMPGARNWAGDVGPMLRTRSWRFGGSCLLTVVRSP